MPLDHIVLSVPQAQFNTLVTFLTTSLSHLNFRELVRPMPLPIGLGDEEHAWFWLSGLDPGYKVAEGRKTHGVIGISYNHEQVHTFHTLALKAGGTCHGAPGSRPQFGEKYYAAFVLDPVCGINFEVVCGM